MASSTTTTADAIAATPTPPNSGLTPTSKSEPDVEKQDSFEKNGPNNLSTEVLEDAEPGLEDNSKVQEMEIKVKKCLDEIGSLNRVIMENNKEGEAIR